jgi:hypothetical protein
MGSPLSCPELIYGIVVERITSYVIPPDAFYRDNFSLVKKIRSFFNSGFAVSKVFKFV